MSGANTGVGRIRITVEFLDHEDNKPSVIEMDDAIILQEAGILETQDPSQESPIFEHNGQQRFTLKAWKGCPTYETFQHRTQMVLGLPSFFGADRG